MNDSSFLIYAPDKGASYGQAPRARGVRRVWDDVQRFLAACTVAEPPSQIALTAYRATQWDSAISADACLDRARLHLGPPDDDQPAAGQRWPSGEPVQGGHLRWWGTPERLPEFLAFVAAGEPWPKQTLGPVELRIHYRFRWRPSVLPASPAVLAAGVALPDSSLSVTLGRRCLVQPALWLPCTPTEPAVAALVATLVPLVPFKFLAKHFRAASPAADGAGFRFATLPRPPIAAA